MKKMSTFFIGTIALLTSGFFATAQEYRLDLSKSNMTVTPAIGNPEALVDEQNSIIGPPVGKPTKSWHIGGQHYKKFPVNIYFNLGRKVPVSNLWIFDTNGKGEIDISVGSPGKWEKIATCETKYYMKWLKIPVNRETTYLQITRKDPASNFSEIALYAHSPESWNARQKQQAETAAKAEARAVAMRRAMAEMKKRPLVDLGSPFGKAYLVEEINCAAQKPAAEHPAGNSKVKTILGKQCRVIQKTRGEAAYFTYLIGKMKMLQPGASYILSVEYPEDAPRTIIVSNTGNETIRGFHTGCTVGDSYYAKYVDSRNESINTPLSGKYETWTHLFRLHDRFTEYNGLPRGGKPRPRLPEQGFYVTIAQFSEKNIPVSHGAAVSRIRLFAVPDPEKLQMKINYPPANLPRRHLFWREEMSDGVVGAGNKRPEKTRGVINFLDWYKYKASRMKFLGMNTFTKDLLEFGANQGWDPTPYGGNNWMYFDSGTKGWWSKIVELMGKEGFEVFPYYEYSGSKGKNGLGFKRRSRPLTNRPGNKFTHISWVENANVDITDPETYTDFKKILDLTVIRLQDKAQFAGIWLRPRSQIPVSFADATLRRFNDETKQAVPATREMLVKNKRLYNSYLKWWGGKRRDFLVAMRDYLSKNGIKNPIMLFTGEPGEPGVGFGTWDKILVTDQPNQWKRILDARLHRDNNKQPVKVITVDNVVDNNMYMKGLLAPGLDWGGHEFRHARPADDPQLYKELDGVLLSHAFNRLYTVASPKTFDAYRTRSGLVAIRHYALNENMMFDKNDKPLLGYFVADMEKAGPYCMMAEAVAMANGDPTAFGYLTGSNYGRGFPEYVRNFNAAFLSLPALPSEKLQSASSDPAVVVRSIKTGQNGTYLAIVNTASSNKKTVITLPISGRVFDAAADREIKTANGKLSLSLYPYQLKSILIK